MNKKNDSGFYSDNTVNAYLHALTKASDLFNVLENVNLFNISSIIEFLSIEGKKETMKSLIKLIMN